MTAENRKTAAEQRAERKKQSKEFSVVCHIRLGKNFQLKSFIEGVERQKQLVRDREYIRRKALGLRQNAYKVKPVLKGLHTQSCVCSSLKLEKKLKKQAKRITALEKKLKIVGAKNDNT